MTTRKFIETIRTELNERLKGYVTIHEVSEMLIIDIMTEDHKAFRYTVDSISTQMAIGMKPEIIAETCVKRYKEYILKNYFKKL